jgi:aminoglycoside phosphotransferase (APT) family kinase protein
MSPEEPPAKPKTSTRDRDDIAAGLAEWLRAVTGADDHPAVHALDPPVEGGLSSETLLFDIAWTTGTQRHERNVVVRLPPPADAWPVFPTYDLGRQAAVMEAVRRSSSVPVPEIFWYEPDPAPIGAPFIVMQRLDGIAAPDYMPYTWGSWVTELAGAEQAQVADRCIDVLAAIHDIQVTPQLADALELHDFDGSPLRRHFRSERARYEWARDHRHFPTIERGFDVLEAHWPEREHDARIGWGDARLGNILWSGGELIAVLDWEMVALTPPEVDLSWMVFFAEYFQRSAQRRGLPGIPGFLGRDSAVARYERATGLEVQHFDWYLCYSAVREAIVSLRTMGRAVHFGEVPAPDDPEGLILDREFLVELVDELARA